MIEFPEINVPSPVPESAVMVNIVSSTKSTSLKILKVILESPWRIGNDAPLKPGNPVYFDADLGVWSCGELLKHIKFQKLHWTSATCKIVDIITPPKHGHLVRLDHGVFRYTPVHGFIGKDKVEFVVEGVDGRRVLVSLPILLQTFSDAYADDKQAAMMWSQKMPAFFGAIWTAWVAIA